MTVPEFEFTLEFKLQQGENINRYVEHLCQNGCHDAVVKADPPDSITLQFTRMAQSYNEAMTLAIIDVRKSIPVETGKLVAALG